jgi:hypothetical protein
VIRKEKIFCCEKCGVTSFGPFKIGGAETQPRCRNDHCETQWWNSINKKPLFDYAVAMEREEYRDVLTLQALAKKPQGKSHDPAC